MGGILSKIAGGVNKAADELINPQSALGKFGAYLGAASGGVLGQAALANQRDMRMQGDQGLERQIKEAQLQKLLNPAAPNNDTINDYNFIRDRLGAGDADSFLRNLASGPPVAVDVQQSDGSVVRQYMPRGQFGGAPPAPRAAPAGVTFTPIDGGQTPRASGGFR